MHEIDRTRVRIVKQLVASIGYFELGMDRQALRSLDAVDELVTPGPFKVAAEVIRAAIRGGGQRPEQAIELLEGIARAMPAAHSEALWMVLSACHRHSGEDQQAVETLACARGALPPAKAK